MPFLYKVIKEQLELFASKEPPEGPGFNTELVAKADCMEIWASNITDSGEDWTEFRLLRGGQVIAQRRVEGY